MYEALVRYRIVVKVSVEHSLSNRLVSPRSRAHNTAQLAMFIADVYDPYVRQRLLDAALHRSRKRRAAATLETTLTVERVTDTTFRVVSESDSETRYDVDTTLGMCTCPSGNTGAVCKHQVACAQEATLQLPQVMSATPENRRWMVGLALGDAKTPPLEFFGGKTESSSIFEEATSKPEAPSPTQNSAGEYSDDDFESSAKKPEHLEPEPLASAPPELPDLLETIRNVVTKFADGGTSVALIRSMGRWNNVKTSSQLNSLLHTTGSGGDYLSRGGAGRGKIRVQPSSISRRAEGQPRGAARLPQGRRPAALPQRPAKRRHCLSINISQNQANAKSHGTGH